MICDTRMLKIAYYSLLLQRYRSTEKHKNRLIGTSPREKREEKKGERRTEQQEIIKRRAARSEKRRKLI